MANVHVDRLTASWANETAPRLVEEAIHGGSSNSIMSTV